VLLKEAVYAAVTLCGFDLYDHVDADALLASRLVPEALDPALPPALCVAHPRATRSIYERYTADGGNGGRQCDGPAPKAVPVRGNVVLTQAVAGAPPNLVRRAGPPARPHGDPRRPPQRRQGRARTYVALKGMGKEKGSVAQLLRRLFFFWGGGGRALGAVVDDYEFEPAQFTPYLAATFTGLCTLLHDAAEAETQATLVGTLSAVLTYAGTLVRGQAVDLHPRHHTTAPSLWY
jgi:hypothetical protein